MDGRGSSARRRYFLSDLCLATVAGRGMGYPIALCTCTSIIHISVRSGVHLGNDSFSRIASSVSIRSDVTHIICPSSHGNNVFVGTGQGSYATTTEAADDHPGCKRPSSRPARILLSTICRPFPTGRPRDDRALLRVISYLFIARMTLREMAHFYYFPAEHRNSRILPMQSEPYYIPNIYK